MSPCALQIRESILRASHASGHGHIPTSFSVVEMLLAVYQTMRHNPAQPGWLDRDLFVLSKAHAALGYYCVLARYGYFDPKHLATLGAPGSILGGHPDRRKIPGVEASCGSLGHGIGIAAGMALALKIQGAGRKVCVLVGDGESNEGSVWEAVLVSADQKLDNLTVLYDHNQSQKRGLQIHNPGARLAAFGCQVHEVDGHDETALAFALRAPASAPKAIVAHTIKGCGCRTLVDNVHEWHRKSPRPDELDRLIGELHAQAV